MILKGGPRKSRRIKLPLIRSKQPGTLDIDKAKIYEIIVPRLVPGGWLVIDNVTSPRLQSELLNRAEKDPRVDNVLLPFPKGDLICRKC